MATSTCTIAHGATTISALAQATSLAANCAALVGSIAVASSYSGSLPLNGLKTIHGDLIATDASSLTSISAPDLLEIDGFLQLSNLPALATLSAPKLSYVGWANWSSIGSSFQDPDLPALTRADQFQIQDTALSSLDWLKLTEGTNLQLTGNALLTSISLPLITNTTVFLENNGGNGQSTADLPNFNGASLSCGGCSELSAPQLADCGDEGFLQVYNSTMDSLSFPALKNCQLIILSNPNLDELSAPVLENCTVPDRMAPYITALSIGNNPKLDGTIEFPALSTLNGASFNGTFAGIALPSLTNETRPLTINSTQDISQTCQHFRSIAGANNIVKGDLKCTYLNGTTSASSGSNSSDTASGSSTMSGSSSSVAPTGTSGSSTATTTSATSSPSTTTSGSSGSGTSTGAGSHASVAVMGGATVAAVAAVFLLAFSSL